MRSHIKYKYAIFTQNNKLDKKDLDLTKTVIINSPDTFIDFNIKVKISSKEYYILLKNKHNIISKLNKYIDRYFFTLFS